MQAATTYSLHHHPLTRAFHYPTCAPHPPLLPFPAVQVFAPYVDIVAWPTPVLQTTISATGQKFFTLAFITAKGTKASWGGEWSWLPCHAWAHTSVQPYVRPATGRL